MLNKVSLKHKAPITASYLICTITLLSILTSIQVYASSPYDSGYDHGCDDAGISDPSDRYINQDEKGPSYHTSDFMNGYYDGYRDCFDVIYDDDDTSNDAYGTSNTGSSKYDCSEGSEGCHGLIYCDINDEGDCYDRYEGSDDGSS